jgi:hypothetical protein
MELQKSWSKEIKDNKYLILLSFILLAVALVIDYMTGTYVQEVQGVSAPDFILDHLPTVDLHLVYIYGIVIIVAFLLLYPLFFRVNEFHEVISQFSLLMAIRGIFTCFTHLTLPAGAIALNVPRALFFLDFTNDLFFSGHTAVPFLGFLLFKKDKIRYFFLASSVIMAMVVLLMHVHYTIDVLSAFFITYGSYKIGARFFDKINAYCKRELKR